MLSATDLPNDIDALKSLLLASERLVRERDATIATQGDALLNMQAQSCPGTALRSSPLLKKHAASRRCDAIID